MNIDYKKFTDAFPEIESRLTLMSFGIDVVSNALSPDGAILLLLYKFLKDAGFTDPLLTLCLTKLREDFKDLETVLLIIDNRYISTSKREQVFDMTNLEWISDIHDGIFIQMFSIGPMFDRYLKPLIIT